MNMNDFEGQNQERLEGRQTTNEAKEDVILDRIVVSYLEKRGFQDVAQELKEKLAVKKAKQISHDGEVVMKSENKSTEEQQPDQVDLDFLNRVGLSTERCTANYILFHGLNNSDPKAYEDGYVNLIEWICNSLDMYKNELYSIAYPLFIHIYLKLIMGGYVSDASNFFKKYSIDHMILHPIEVRKISMVLNKEQLKTSEFAQGVLNSKFTIQMSLLSFELLNSFLNDSRVFLLLSIINERISIVVTRNRPPVFAEQVQEHEESSIGLKPMRDRSTTYSKAVSLAKVAAARAEEAGIGIQIGADEYEFEYSIRASGGTSDTFTDGQTMPVRWGVLPPRCIRPEITKAEGGVELEKAGDGTTKETDESIASTTANNNSNKNSTSMVQPTVAFSVLGKGPVPDRKDDYNANILEKLVTRQSAAEKKKELDDLRNRFLVTAQQLPSVLCYTFVNCHRGLNSIAFNSDATMTGAGFEDSSFRVYRNDHNPLGTPTGVMSLRKEKISDDQRYAVLRGHAGSVYSGCFSPDSRFALTASADSTIRLWSLATRTNLVCYRAHQYAVWDVKFSPLGYYFVSASADRTARLWSTDRIQPLRIFAGHTSDVDCCEFHPNSNYVATGSCDRTVRVWDVQTGRCVRVFASHYGYVTSLAFSPNGQYLASAGDDAFINVWDIASGKRLTSLMGHESRIHSLDFSNEGSILASGGSDCTVRLWDVASMGDSSSSLTDATNRTTNMEPRNTPIARKNTTKSSSKQLIKTYCTKSTPVYTTQFTSRNLLLVGGCFDP